MRKKRNSIILAILAVTLPALLWWLYPKPLPGINVTSTEAAAIFPGKVTAFGGLASLNLRQAVTDRAYLKMRCRWLFGAKLKSLVTTNASLSALAATFAVYSNGEGVIIPEDPWVIPTLHMGEFDSGRFRTRWQAARGIAMLLHNMRWHVVGLADGKVAFLSPGQYELLLAAKSPSIQENLLHKFDRGGDPQGKWGSAQILSNLWQVGFLGDRVKGQLVEKHYHLVFRQLPNAADASWDVRHEHTFPFPDVWTDFTPTLYCNGQVKWSPGRPQTSHAMNATSDERNQSSPITSMTGGEFRNGDVLQCRIELAQKINGRLWQMNLWTDKLILQDLKR